MEAVWLHSCHESEEVMLVKISLLLITISTAWATFISKQSKCCFLAIPMQWKNSADYVLLVWLHLLSLSYSRANIANMISATKIRPQYSFNEAIILCFIERRAIDSTADFIEVNDANDLDFIFQIYQTLVWLFRIRNFRNVSARWQLIGWTFEQNVPYVGYEIRAWNNISCSRACSVEPHHRKSPDHQFGSQKPNGRQKWFADHNRQKTRGDEICFCFVLFLL